MGGYMDSWATLSPTPMEDDLRDDQAGGHSGKLRRRSGQLTHRDLVEELVKCASAGPNTRPRYKKPLLRKTIF